MHILEHKAGKFCIKFEEIIRDACEKCKHSFLYIQSPPGSGCSSRLGMEGGRQTLNISKMGCMNEGIIIHELMHTLGFVHEHTRGDRDRYIDVHEENILPGSTICITFDSWILSHLRLKKLTFQLMFASRQRTQFCEETKGIIIWEAIRLPKHHALRLKRLLKERKLDHHNKGKIWHVDSIFQEK